jgi:hypothetical protein
MVLNGNIKKPINFHTFNNSLNIYHKINMSETIYPEPVIAKIKPIMESLKKQNFYSDEEADEKVTYECFANFFMKQFIAGKEFTIEVEDFSDLLTESIIISHFESLKSKGLMDSIDDPNINDEVYFITPAGKELVELARKVDAIKPINKKPTTIKKTTKKKEK